MSARETFGYFGPEGTFTQAALRQWHHQHNDAEAAEALLAESVPYATVPAALDAVREGEVDAVMVPIENSVEGGVSSTLDALNSEDSEGTLRLVGEVLVPITFVLAVRPGTREDAITGVGSHSHAWPQVRGWMAKNLPGATYVPTLSTAAAAQGLARGEFGQYQAAVCAPMAAQVFGLETLATDIGDNVGAVTRFVLVKRARGRDGGSSTPEPTGLSAPITEQIIKRWRHSTSPPLQSLKMIGRILGMSNDPAGNAPYDPTYLPRAMGILEAAPEHSELIEAAYRLQTIRAKITDAQSTLASATADEGVVNIVRRAM